MLKVMTIVGTRPEIIRLSRVIAKLDEFCDQTLVHTGQNYDHELSRVFFDQLEIRSPDIFLNAAGETAAETIGNTIKLTDEILTAKEPDAVLVLGDTNSCLSVIAAKRRKIPIFHMEAGNRCFDFRVPEEINRRIVDHTADIHLTYSAIARDYLIKEGVAADQIIKTGSPMREVLDYYRPAIDGSPILGELGLVSGDYFVLSVHREENVDDKVRLGGVVDIANYLADEPGKTVIVSTHPRTRAHLDKLKLSTHERVQFHKPFGFCDYVHLQQHAACVLSDSGTVTEESSILNFPALNLREMHERPEGFEEAAVMLVGLSIERVRQALNILSHQKRGATRDLDLVADYAPRNVSEKVVRIIHSYTDFVNRVVWKKY